MYLRQPRRGHLVRGQLLLEQPGEEIAYGLLEMIGEPQRSGPGNVEAGVPLAGVGLLDQMREPRRPHLFLAVDRPRHRRQSRLGRVHVVRTDAQTLARRLVDDLPVGRLEQGAERDLRGEPAAALACPAIAAAELIGCVSLGPVPQPGHWCHSRMWLRMWSGTAALG